MCEKKLNESLPVVTDRQTDRQTDTISACRLSTLPRERIKQQSSITNPHSETGHFHIKSMPICGKFGAASAAGWGAGAAIFSPVGRVVLLHKLPNSRTQLRSNDVNPEIPSLPISLKHSSLCTFVSHFFVVGRDQLLFTCWALWERMFCLKLPTS